MIAESPGIGAKPASTSIARNRSVFARSVATSEGSSRSASTAASALQATVAGRAFEKSWGRERCARSSQMSALAAT